MPVSSNKMPKSQNSLSVFWNNSNFMLWFVIFILFCFGVYLLRSVLLPFVLGILIGYLLDPLASKFEKLKMSRTAATIWVFVLVIVLAVPLFVILFSVLNKQLSVFIEAAPMYINSFLQYIEPLLAKLQIYVPSFDFGNVKNMLGQNMSQSFQLGGKLMQGLMKNSLALINLLSLLLITPIVAFYMLRDWDIFVRKVDGLLPRKSKKSIRQIFRKIDRSLSGFIRGQLSVCFILGTYYALALRLSGLELGLLVGFIAGIISFIPYVGSITGFVLSIVLALSQFGSLTKVIEVVLIFLVGQFVEGNFLTPKLVGDKIGLHPVWVMFSLLAGGVLLGFLGLMLAVPIAAVLAILLRASVEKYKASALYLEE